MIIRLLGPTDADVLKRVAPGVFDHDVDARLTAEFLADPRHHLIVAIDADQTVGFVSAVHYVHPDKPQQLWLNEVGVAETHRRMGVGRMLMDRALELGKSLECTDVWVLTDAENTAACRLYERAGGQASSSVMYSFPLDTAD